MSRPGMDEKYYIHLEPLSTNKYIYGVLSIMDNTPFDYAVNQVVGKREDVIDYIAKKIITTNSEKLDRSYFNLRFSELSDTKTMLKLMKEDDFYSDYIVSTSPAVFLSDMDKVNNIKAMVTKEIMAIRMYQNSHPGNE